jgi:hypothetical protein
VLVLLFWTLVVSVLSQRPSGYWMEDRARFVLMALTVIVATPVLYWVARGGGNVFLWLARGRSRPQRARRAL